MLNNLDWSKPIQTRDGRKAELLRKEPFQNSLGDVLYAVLVHTRPGNKVGAFLQATRPDGADGFSDTNDIINVPKEEWVRMYQSKEGNWECGGVTYSSREEAQRMDIPSLPHLGYIYYYKLSVKVG